MAKLDEELKLQPDGSPVRDRYGNLFYWMTTYLPLSERGLALGLIPGSLSPAGCAQECASRGGIEEYNGCAATTLVASWTSGSKGSRVFQCTKTTCRCKLLNSQLEELSNKCIDGGKLVQIFTAGGATRDFSITQLVKPENMFVTKEGCIDPSKPCIVGYIQGINPGERWKRACPVVRSECIGTFGPPVGEPCYVVLRTYSSNGRSEYGSLSLVSNP